MIVETTGLADPLPVAMTINGARDQLRLDSIITLVDAENFNNDTISSQIARSQIIYGDIILINKCDLVTQEKIASIELEISNVKSNPRILQSIKGENPLPLLISVGLFQSDLIAKSNNHDHDHDEEESSIEGFTSFSFQSKFPFSLRKFQNFLDNCLPDSVYRAKGLLWFEESELTHIFHLSGKRFTMDDTKKYRSQENKVVLIGKNLDHKKLYEELDKCICYETEKYLK